MGHQVARPGAGSLDSLQGERFGKGAALCLG